MKRGIYVHFPFCIKKCRYCDFNSFATLYDKQNQYKDTLIREIKSLKSCDVPSIYLGGGTPSTVDDVVISDVLNEIYNKFHILQDCEITIEVNPGTVTLDKLKTYKNMGINRISIGVQSLCDDNLKFLGRIHTAYDAINAYDMAVNAGFENISLDLMFALPNQSMSDLSTDVSKLLTLSPAHISCYGLKIEQDTALFNDLKKGKITECGDDLYADMYELVCNMLNDAGYEHYEISNFCKKGYHSKHNSSYWKCKEYYGVGAGASSYVESVRFDNVKDPYEYITDFSNKINVCQLSNNDKMSEFVILGLRLLDEGISKTEFEKNFGCDIYEVFGEELKKYTSLGLLSESHGTIRLNRQSYCVCNTILSDFLL